MKIKIRGAREHNLKGVDVEIGDGLTAVTGISGSGKTSLIFDTLYHEAQRRFLEVYERGLSSSRMAPARVARIEGLPPAVAVGQNLLNRNPNSTLASASGLHPFIRLLFAHFAQRRCPHCDKALTFYTREEAASRLVAFSYQSLPLAIPLIAEKSGSHASLLRLLAEKFGRDQLEVDGQVWNGSALDKNKNHTIRLLRGNLHPELSLREARGLIEEAAQMGAPFLCVGEETLCFAPMCTSCGAWLGELRPQDFHFVCPRCGGVGCEICRSTGLPPSLAGVRWAGLNFREFLAQTVKECADRFKGTHLPSSRLQDEMSRRLEALETVGLGYLSLDRPSPSLSRGEAQRVRLALTLVNRLEDLLHILDEPTVGLHPADVERLLPAFRDLAGPVIFVEHDRTAIARADRIIDIGPGAGSQGGEIIFEGTPAQLWRAGTLSGEWFSLRKTQSARAQRQPPDAFLKICGAELHNLHGVDVQFPLKQLTVVSGVSGSGKSSLVEGVLAASWQAGRAVGCRDIEGGAMEVVIVDQSPIGKNPRSNPATYTKLADQLRDFLSRSTGLPASYFSFNRPEGACPGCEGLGAIEVSMRYLPSIWIPCEQCLGQRFSGQVLAATVNMQGKSYSIADILNLSVKDALALLRAEDNLSAGERASALSILSALEEIGLGYLPLGQPSPSLSGGEAQRVKLARYLGMRSLRGRLLILDEPSTGLHPYDLAGLLSVLHRLTDCGATIVVVEHHLDIIRSADWIIDLGPGAGEMGGKILYSGPPEGLSSVSSSLTAAALRSDQGFVPSQAPAFSIKNAPESIRIRGARANNLHGVDLDIPKGKLTVVSGLSGSGKSSLVEDVLEGEARRRYLETLSMYERQATKETAGLEVEEISGLGVTLRAAPEKLAYSRRATVGLLSQISYHLSALLASLGERKCLACGSQMEREQDRWFCHNCGAEAELAVPQHFLSNTYASACKFCHGVGTLQQPNPAKLIVAPQRPLCAGAMYSPGFFPDGYLGKPGNGGYDHLQALARHYGFDPHTTPWDEMAVAAQQAFLFGSSEELEVIRVSRTGRVSNYQAKFPGFYGFVRDWDVGNTYTDNIPCPECQGARLRPEYLAVTLGAKNIHQMSLFSLAELQAHLQVLEVDFRQLKAAENSLSIVRKRLSYLNRVGLGYLSLLRPAGTLSAGEVQRIRLAGLLGSDLTALTILLDEPTRGLHPSEVHALGSMLCELRDAGNTVIVVEHDLDILRMADNLVEMGPGAGAQGGQVVAVGTPQEVARGQSVSAAWISGVERPFTSPERRNPTSWMTLKGPRANNLKGRDVQFPLKVLCGVCGLSGSGKSTLVIDTLGRLLAPRKQTTSVAYEPLEPGENEGVEGAPQRVIVLDQARSGLSSPANWLGIRDGLRAIYAESPEAHALGLTLEVLAMGCPACGGSGDTSIDMGFLPDLHDRCDVCHGTGYLPEASNVHIQGISLPDVLGLTIAEVYEIFHEDERVSRQLKIAMDVGLGYLVLRQLGRTLSGGEVQRLKIAQELGKKSPRGSLYILDEPTVGQHLEDVRRLVQVLGRLVEDGGSVLVVEHHPHLLAACDWLIELGPGGGPQGGEVIASGPPELIARGDSPIAPYLRAILRGAS